MRLAAQDRIIPSDSGFDGFATTIPMRDGKALAADVYRPRSAGRYPVILIQTPYNKSLMRPWWAGVGQYGKDSLFTDTHYAFVVTDRRGRHGPWRSTKRRGRILRRWCARFPSS